MNGENIIHANLEESRAFTVFNQQDLADRWGVSKALVSRWRTAGRIPVQNVYGADGRAIGWTGFNVYQIEAMDADLAARALNMRDVRDGS